MKYFKLITVFLFIFSYFHIALAEDKVLFSTPVDSDIYLIRPGDQLEISFMNSSVQPISLTVNPEGFIIHETIGLLDLNVKSLKETKNELLAILNELYKVDNISVSIKEPREVMIAIYGAVKNPGYYSGNTSQRASSIIAKAGGITKNGSKRNIVFKTKYY